jgi:Dyp-type peroxidase family
MSAARTNEPVLEADDIQGNILPGFNTHFMRLMGLRIEDVETARPWLRAMRALLSSLRTVAAIREERRKIYEASPAEQPERMPSPITVINLALSYDGLRLLMGYGADAAGDAWFKAGMYNVAGSLGDDVSSLDSWRTGGKRCTTPHVLVIFGDDDEDRLDDRWARVAAEVSRRGGLAVTFDQRGARLAEDREHFGFREGISIPAVRGVLSETPGDFLYPRRIPAGDPLATRFAKPGQVLVWPGQAVFGYPAQSAYSLVEPADPEPVHPAWMRNGSFLVFRRLRQDVAAFRTFVEQEAHRLQVPKELFEAMLVGRRRDGTPLVREQHGPDPAYKCQARADAVRQLADNHFAYAIPTPPVLTTVKGVLAQIPGAEADLHGDRCPQAAHIRKVNPRDAPTDLGDEAQTLALQIFRRGIPFGPPHKDDPEAERGLLFLAYTTAIETRFGTLNSAWLNRDDAPEHGRPGFDLIVGQNESGGGRRARLPLPGGKQDVMATRTWVTPTGGGFFFAPAISLLDRLGQRTAARSARTAQRLAHAVRGGR